MSKKQILNRAKKTLTVELNSLMATSHESTVTKISLIQPVQFKIWEAGLCKMPCFEMPHFQNGSF